MGLLLSHTADVSPPEWGSQVIPLLGLDQAAGERCSGGVGKEWAGREASCSGRRNRVSIFLLLVLSKRYYFFGVDDSLQGILTSGLCWGSQGGAVPTRAELHSMGEGDLGESAVP